MIQNIELTLESTATKKYIVRARITSIGGRSVDAIAKETSLPRAQESAIKAAKERFEEEFGVKKEPELSEEKAEVLKQNLAELPAEGKAPGEQAAITNLVNSIGVEVNGKMVLEPGSQSTHQADPLAATTPQRKQEVETTPQAEVDAPIETLPAQELPPVAKKLVEQLGAEEVAPKSTTDQASTVTPQLSPRAKAMAELEAWCLREKLPAKVLEAIVRPDSLDTTSGANLLQLLRDLTHPGDTDIEVVKPGRERLMRCTTMGSLKQVWQGLNGKGWAKLNPHDRLILWKQKETCKEKLANPPATPKPTSEGLKRCDCGAEIRFVTTAKNPHPLNQDNKPVLLEGEGKGEKRWVMLQGVHKLVSTWPAKPGQQGSVSSYTSHFSTCPKADKFRRGQGKAA